MNRTRCTVPFCRRTTAEQWTEWLCPKHWRLVDRRYRLAHKKHLRKRPGRASPFWRRCVEQAVVRGAFVLHGEPG